MTTSNALVLAQTFAAGSTNGRLAKNIILAILGSLAIWVSAKIQVPFYPVPMTMQVFVILAIGAAFGSRLGLATVLLYLAEGAAGLPVFAGTPEKGIGFAYMVGPTGGYLVGFALAACITGFFAERGWDRSYFKTAIAMLLGLSVIYLVGVTWLALPFSALVVAGGSTFTGIGLEKAITYGFMPFWIGDLVKVALATALFPMVWKFLGNK